MAPPASAVLRKLKHTRRIDVQVFERDDGLWELEARLTDVKTRDCQLGPCIRRAGDPIHDMTLRLVFDVRMNIVDAGARTDGMPYPGHCEAYGEAYRRLIGLNFLRQFRQRVKERLGGIEGCTHLTEMTQVLPTAVVQAFAGEVLNTQDTQENGSAPSDDKPFQLDRCHALRSDGEAVRTYYPRWYRRAPAADSQNS